MENKIDAIFWFRRDLRLHDNVGLFHTLEENESVLPVFIFDSEILGRLEDKTDARVTFIFDALMDIRIKLKEQGKELLILYGDVEEQWEKIIRTHEPNAIYTNRDYEPYARVRDEKIERLAAKYDCEFKTYKDQVIFEPGEVLKDDGKPYVVYTPYSKKWMLKFNGKEHTKHYPSEKHLNKIVDSDIKGSYSLKSIGFERSMMDLPKLHKTDHIKQIVNRYGDTRDYPGLQDGTTRLGVHLRFGTVSIREMTKIAVGHNDSVWGRELIWREFFMQLLYYYPKTPKQAFKPKYDNIKWRTGKKADADFEAWTRGETGYAIVDAGMHELNKTGYMHNRVRMITAAFLCKHLMIDWRRGERYFAQKLLDYELASNVGNWQWAAGSGADAAPYFRIFNPYTQQKKFDPDMEYITRWAPEHTTDDHPTEIVDYKEGRERALQVYKDAVG